MEEQLNLMSVVFVMDQVYQITHVIVLVMLKIAMEFVVVHLNLMSVVFAMVLISVLIIMYVMKVLILMELNL